MLVINSASNQKIKDLTRLKKASERRLQKMAMIDGSREITLASEAKLEIVELLYCPTLVKKEVQGFFGVSKEKIVELSEIAFNKLCYKENPDGYLAVVKLADKNISQIKLSKNPLVVVLEAVEKPGNLGAIIRTVYAAGADAIIINDNQTDIYNPNVIRASEGFVFVVPIVTASTLETANWLKEKGITSYAAVTSSKTVYTKESLSKPAAIILGSEADGLSDFWLKKADKLVKIPMTKGIDSLNVSVSAAIILYEALRQRNK